MNLIVVMSVAGFWHGARWNFILWGFYWGVLLAGYHLLKAYPALSLRPLMERMKLGRLHTVVSRGLMLWIIVTASLLFRSQSGDQLTWMLMTYMDLPSYWTEWSHVSMPYLGVTVAVFLLGGVFGQSTYKVLHGLYSACPLWLRSALMTMLALLCCVLLQKPLTPFIYFQF